ncbi:MAG: PQQ-binding-like beta-propeller repeat protein [Planctomycetota bacterium]
MGARLRTFTLRIPYLLAAGCAISLAAVWAFAPEGHRQARIERTYVVVGSFGALLVLWTLFLSRLRLAARLAIAAGLLAAGGLGAALVRFRGVTGDLVLILEWRTREPPARELPPEAQAAKVAPSDLDAAEAAWLDFPQFLGPERNGTVPGVRLARDWVARPPRLVWSRDVGAGWSGFAVSGRRAFTQEQRGEEEIVACYDLLTGALLWAHADRARFEKSFAGVGPRATPTVEGKDVYALGATGILNCLDRSSGARRWSRNVVEENRATPPEWGVAGSPLVLGRLVVVNAGGPEGRSLVAYDRSSGEIVWSGGSDRAGYSSPARATIAGVPQVLVFNHSSVAAHDERDGRPLWGWPWAYGKPNVAQPLAVPGDRVFVSSGYGVGCALLDVRRTAKGAYVVEEAWQTTSLKAKFANFVRRGDFVYGLDDGTLVCVDLETGARRWKGARYGHGQLLLVEDLVLVSAEQGAIALVEAVPDGFREAARHPALGEKTWNSPALAAPYLLLRNDRRAACYELPLDAPPAPPR